jgi:hypothetical protein
MAQNTARKAYSNRWCILNTCADCGKLMPGKPSGRSKCPDCLEPPCEMCGKPFRRKNHKGVQARTCGRTCGIELRRREGTLGAHAGQSCGVPWKDCPRCDARFIGRSRYCKDCPPLEAMEYYWQITRPKKIKPVQPTVCKECGTCFVYQPVIGKQGPHRTRFCSDQCSKRYADRHSRHHQRQDPGTPSERFGLLEIAERDNWECHICRKPVKQTDWSMDHLIPMSQGGWHLRSNVALAHRLCNSRRGAGRIPAQLRLIG